MGELIKCSVEIYNIKRYKNDWCIARAVIDTPPKDSDFRAGEGITIKGVLPTTVKEKFLYNVTLEIENDPKWGQQFLIKNIYASVCVDPNDEIGKARFLRSIFTEKQVNNMYKALKDPFQALMDRDAEALIKVHGVQLKTMSRWFDKFSDNYCKARIFIELEDYNLTNNMIDHLIERYGSPDVVVDKVKSNPYVLCTEVDGIGWKTADKIALSGGLGEYCKERIKAYMLYYMGQAAEQGMSWITPDELLGAVFDNIGEGMEDTVNTEAILECIEEGKVWASENKKRLGLAKYRRLEELLAKEIIRIRDAESNIEVPDDWEDALKKVERLQGWEFTEEQKEGIRAGLNNNICTITGYGGTGKSSLVSGILEALKGHSFVQTALAGRAASRMAEITGEDGYTIHRLLGYPTGPSNKGLFAFNDEKQLSYEIYIIDEGSMIDVSLYLALLRAIPSGSKVYILGDPGQLESIGAGNVLHDLIASDEICSVQLTQIHRQAAKSAIITESIKARKGIQLLKKDTAGTETRGELQDLTITYYSDTSNTFYEVNQAYSKLLEDPNFDVMETQIIVPMKERGSASAYNINLSVQELYNPLTDGMRQEYVLNFGKGYYLREGDKVINVKNNYHTSPAIYNGNIGTIVGWEFDEIENDDVMIVDFLGIGEVRLAQKYWNSIELAYAITTHKSQGSQFDHVIYAFDFASMALLTREQVYTGITRAKKKCHMICQTNSSRLAIGQAGVSRKQTHLQDLLYELVHPKLVF